MPKDTTLAGAALTDALRDLPHWAEHGGAIERTYHTDGWPTTIMLVNLVAFQAEAADHHPELLVGWNTLTVRLNTHSAGGITQKDIELARHLESSALWRPEGGALTGTRKEWVATESA